MIMEHVGITVNNLDRSIRFYTKVFGFKVLRKTPTSAYLFLDNELLELTQSKKPLQPTCTKNAEELLQNLNVSTGLSHIGFRVNNLDKKIENLEKLGGKLIIPPFRFKLEIDYVADVKAEKLKRASYPPKNRSWWRIAAFADPDGVILELVER